MQHINCKNIKHSKSKRSSKTKFVS